MTAPLPEPPRARARLAVGGLLLAACAATFLLNGFRVFYPVLQQDDFQIIAQSWTWQGTWAGIMVPQNEHTMPLGRLLTRGLVLLAGRPTALPQVTALVGPCALVAAVPLVYLFVRRELGHAFYGVLAAILFGVTAVYQQAVYWFAASFSVLALDMLLLALLAAQEHLRWDRALSAEEPRDSDDDAYTLARMRHRRTMSRCYLALCAALCALAPCWFASGVLVGPLCCLYLLPAERGTVVPGTAPRLRSALVRLTPLLGTLAFLAVSLPFTANTILHLEHYEMQHTTAVGAFRPDKGLYLTGKALVENLLLGLVGICELPVPGWLAVFVLLPLLFLAGTSWWRRARPEDRRVMLLGLGLIFANYLLVYSARSRWAESLQMCGQAWCRYNLGPQLGLALFVCGGLPAHKGRGRWLGFALNTSGALTAPQVVGFAFLIVLSLLFQITRGVAGAYNFFPRQQADLRRIEAVDACCREHHIAANAARRCLPPLAIEGSIGAINGWALLWGSDDPAERPDEEVRRVLEGCEASNENRGP
jgi:hypothetical protein